MPLRERATGAFLVNHSIFLGYAEEGRRVLAAAKEHILGDDPRGLSMLALSLSLQTCGRAP
jgi:hypothetical protein